MTKLNGIVNFQGEFDWHFYSHRRLSQNILQRKIQNSIMEIQFSTIYKENFLKLNTAEI